VHSLQPAQGLKQLPSIMHLRPYALIVDSTHALHGLFTQWREVGGARVIFGLLGILRARYNSANFWIHQYPAQGELGHRRALRDQLTQLLDGLQAGIVVHAGEGLALVEGLAVPVVDAMIALRKLCIAAELSTEHAAGERNAYNDANLPLAGGGEELIGGLEAEHIEDNLHALHVGISDGLEGLFNLLHTDAIVADLALPHEVVEDAEDLWIIVNLCWRTVQLQEIKRLHIQVAQTTLHKAGQVLAIVARRDMRIESATRFCSNEDTLAVRLAHLATSCSE
jgi:hypothetical protein